MSVAPDRRAATACSPMPGAEAPWMPLHALMELWVAYGRCAESVPALKATSAAFAAIAAEREALRTASDLAERVHGELERMFHLSCSSLSSTPIMPWPASRWLRP